MNFETFELKNGLKLIIHVDKSTSLSVFNILYKVGARDENPNKTGLAHLFEHLMFGGSVNVPDYDRVLQKAGGENNAFTNNDITNYYISIPNNNLEIAFYLESDRMLQPAFSAKGLEIQKSVVIEEFKQNYLNQPYGDVSLNLRPLAFKKHPYRWSTIGKNIQQIENIDLTDVKEFFNKYYSPDNAILVIAGNVNPKEVIRLTEKWFGNIEKRNVQSRNLTTEPKQRKKRTKTLERNVSANAIYMAYHMCARNDKNYYASDLITDILSSGRSSRFNINLIKGKKVFSELDAYIHGSTDPGLLLISGKLFPDVSFSHAEEEIKKELNKICTGDFSKRELDKVKNRVIAIQNFSRTDILNKAMELAYFEFLGGAELINTIDTNYSEVSKEQIVNNAKSIFKDTNLSCLYYKSINKNGIS